MRYLDPKADLTFKSVFGEHPDIVISFLNALLPLKEDEQIVEMEYLSPEMIPENPLNKYSIVDVRCKDNFDRQLIVEMQMAWFSEFKQLYLQCRLWMFYFISYIRSRFIININCFVSKNDVSLHCKYFFRAGCKSLPAVIVRDSLWGLIR